VAKKKVDYDSIRRAMEAGADSESLWGPYTNTCPSCGIQGLPQEFEYCGICAARLT